MKYLIAGLGNIGHEYAHTRHNAGFEVLDHIEKQSDPESKYPVEFETARLGDIAEYRFKGRRAILLKPNTYMNLSGKAVAYWLQKEKIPVENLLVITDDIALPFGTLRMRSKGSAGGHNGLKDIEAHLGNQNYARLKFGVGSDFGRGRQVEYVLGKWDEMENAEMPDLCDRAKKFINSFMLVGAGRTMNDLNKKG